MDGKPIFFASLSYSRLSSLFLPGGLILPSWPPRSRIKPRRMSRNTSRYSTRNARRSPSIHVSALAWKRARRNVTSARILRCFCRRKLAPYATPCRNSSSIILQRRGKYTARKRTGTYWYGFSTTGCKQTTCMSASRKILRNSLCFDSIGSSRVAHPKNYRDVVIPC